MEKFLMGNYDVVVVGPAMQDVKPALPLRVWV